MRSELRDKVAELLMEAIQHRDRSLLLFWLRAYCQVSAGCDPPTVPFARLAHFVRRHQAEIRWCGDAEASWGQRLVADSGLFHPSDAQEVTIAPKYRRELSLICTKAAAYWTFLRDLHRRRYPPGLSGTLQQAALLWQHQLFFEFHELLEGIWMDWRGPERRFLQGLIQLGVAFYQIQRNNYRGAMSMFRNGWAKTASHAPQYCGVELKKFLGRVNECRERLERLGPGCCHQFDWSLLPPLEVAGQRRSAASSRDRSVLDRRPVGPRS
jgi:hypothetical protein